MHKVLRAEIEGVDFEDVSNDGLTRVQWKFYFVNRMLVVDEYTECVRLTKRHGYKVSRHWERLRQDRNSMKAGEVPFTDEIATRARQAFLHKIDGELTVCFPK